MGNMEKMNLEAVTIEDCIEIHQKKNKCVVLSNGKVLGFVEDQASKTSTFYR